MYKAPTLTLNVATAPFAILDRFLPAPVESLKTYDINCKDKKGNHVCAFQVKAKNKKEAAKKAGWKMFLIKAEGKVTITQVTAK